MIKNLTDYADCVSTETWSARDITITLDDDGTDDPFITVDILTPIGGVKVMAEAFIDGTELNLRGLHVHRFGDNTEPFGSAWRKLADAVMEEINCDAIRIEGAPRTTGANPGRRQIPWFQRRVFPARKP